jgi:predicted nucleic acid-binding protein
VISEAMKRAPDRHVMAWLRAQPLAELATTAVTLAEIDYGLRRLPRGRRRDDLTRRVETFLA